MAPPIEAHAILSDTHAAALVTADGTIDWLTFPRFDSPACMASLLGDEHNGQWSLRPTEEVVEVKRRYRPDTLVLETDLRTSSGTVRITDCMPVRVAERLDLVRRVVALQGEVPMSTRFSARMDDGSVQPWVTRTSHGARLVAGPDALELTTEVALEEHDGSLTATFVATPAQAMTFDLAWTRSFDAAGPHLNVDQAIEETTRWWTTWSDRRTRFQHYDDVVAGSVVFLKGLTYAPSGGLVAAATTSLPEAIGGTRNWDYRYCWLRDATFTLTALRDAGYEDAALAWRDWLLRAIAGELRNVQIMYGAAGERRIDERTVPWLSGYEDSGPVRVGNGAQHQFQLDVYGEVLDTLCSADMLDGHPQARLVAQALAEVANDRWSQPDDGIWEMRGRPRQYTHSKIMAWVALDRAVRIARRSTDPADRSRAARLASTAARIKSAVLEQGIDDRGILVQEFGGSALDASLLLVPIVGFLPSNDRRVVATTDAIAERLSDRGFIHRYDPDEVDDGVGGDEGAFLLCTLWLARVYAMQGRRREAIETFERVLEVRNDVGMLSEMYDPGARRLLGNIPQAFSHTGLVTTAIALDAALRDPRGAAEPRG